MTLSLKAVAESTGLLWHLAA